MKQAMTLEDVLAHENRIQVRVTYHDADIMGHAYYARYLVWFEMGRTEWIRDFGVSYKELEQRGILLPVRECRVRYHAPAMYDDLITVVTRAKELTRTRLEFECRVEQADGALVAEGSTLHPFVSPERRVLRAGYDVFGIND
ncbi:acyl-CoA thioesterase [Candidatus Sumerlaeota bacterium]|nr:acyl-CoA thioesterase [Candidatus Sumerlaeota bacterium]